MLRIKRRRIYQLTVFTLNGYLHHRPFQHTLKFLFSGRLQNIVKTSEGNCFFHILKIHMSSKENKLTVRITFQYPFGKADAVFDRHDDITQENIIIHFFHFYPGIFRTSRYINNIHWQFHFSDMGIDRIQNQWFIINNQYVHPIPPEV